MIKYLRIGCGVIPHLFKASFWIGRYNRKKEKYSYQKRYAKTRKLIQNAIDHFRIDFYVDGLENINENNSLLVCNHLAIMDAVVLINTIEKPISFLAKIEAKKLPWFGKIISLIDGEFLERDNLRQEIKVIRKISDQLEKENRTWVIFPEGTRNKNSDFSLNEFKAGAIKAAYNAKCSITPIAIFGTQRIMNKHLHKKRYAVQISILKPISYDDFKDCSTVEFSLKLHDIIESRVKELIKKDEELMKEKKYH